MKVVFRVDASAQMGIGHFMRCLTLAESLRERGAQIRFFCREHTGNLISLLGQNGILVSALPAPPITNTALGENYAAWLGVTQAEDAEQSIEALNGEKPDWLVVDHYGLDIEWEQRLRPHASKLMVIDDLANRHHDCDALLDQNLGRQAQDYAGLVPAACQILVGPHYALLRPEFAALRDYSLQQRIQPKLKHLLVSMGGVDQPDATSQVLRALECCTLPPDCHITVVLGTNAPWLNRVQEIATSLPWATSVMVDVTQMAQLMADSDLAIGAAGSTSWERCCLGLPTILLVTANNQKMAARHLQQTGAVILLDHDWSPAQLQSILHRVVSVPLEMQSMVIAAAEIIDGKGTLSVSNYLLESA